MYAIILERKLSEVMGLLILEVIALLVLLRKGRAVGEGGEVGGVGAVVAAEHLRRGGPAVLHTCGVHFFN